jgi:hypothetical protein
VVLDRTGKAVRARTASNPGEGCKVPGGRKPATRRTQRHCP